MRITVYPNNSISIDENMRSDHSIQKEIGDDCAIRTGDVVAIMAFATESKSYVSKKEYNKKYQVQDKIAKSYNQFTKAEKV
jgi:hypothetical protein